MSKEGNESKEKLSELLHQLNEIDYVHPEDIPNIDLYMDQVLTFLDQKLGTVQEATEEKAMTKTMINNYTKNQLLPPPEKKKYSRDHMINLIYIYYMKNFLSMKDIKSILDPINEQYFGSQEGRDFYNIYSEVVNLESTASKDLIKDVIKKYNISRGAFEDMDEESRRKLQDFSFICLLSFDVFVKKMMIEQFIADRQDEDKSGQPKEEGKDKGKKQD